MVIVFFYLNVKVLFMPVVIWSKTSSFIGTWRKNCRQINAKLWFSLSIEGRGKQTAHYEYSLKFLIAPLLLKHLKYILKVLYRYSVAQYFYFFINPVNIFAFPFLSMDLSMSCLLHQMSIYLSRMLLYLGPSD